MKKLIATFAVIVALAVPSLALAGPHDGSEIGPQPNGWTWDE